MRNPTVHDVARKAGVSIATVSRVLNTSGPVSAESAQRVMKAVAQTGFRANRMGRQLKTGRSRTIGVLVPSLRNPVFADAAEGIQSAAEQLGYGVLLMSARYSAAHESRAIETLLESRVDGVLLTVADDAHSDALDLLRRARCPFVTMFNPVAQGEAGVTIDNVAAADAMATELAAAGHRRIDMIAGSLRQSDRSRLRREGFRRALRRKGLPAGRVIEVDIETSDLVHEVQRLLAADDPATAIFCSTDMLAVSTIRALRALGREVPRDVAVAGFDGVALGEWLTPSLATVVQPAEDIGRASLSHLVDRIERGVAPRRIDLPHRLRGGDSIGPPRKAR